MHHSCLMWFAVGSKVELTIQWLLFGIPGQKYLLHALCWLLFKKTKYEKAKE